MVSERIITCGKCGEAKPESDYYRARRPNGKTYRIGPCKTCAKAESSRRYFARKALRPPKLRPEPKRGRGSTENRDAYGTGLERRLHGSPGYRLMHEMCEAVEQAMMRAGLKRFTGRDQSADEQPDPRRSYRAIA